MAPEPLPDYLVYSECEHEPIGLWRDEGIRAAQVGDYGLCWCDDERERRVVRIEEARP